MIWHRMHAELIECLAHLVVDIKRRIDLSPRLNAQRRKKLGQFMTPVAVAKLLASRFASLPKSVRLLDAGAGIGALTVAFVEKACGQSERPTSIDVTAIEVDAELVQALEAYFMRTFFLKLQPSTGTKFDV